ncbi:MAG: GTPase [Candidatus Heimdallarchaeota archaeon]|nr:MAG: GTPase [Candidatus Heimdallarchaeota archaeon]
MPFMKRIKTVILGAAGRDFHNFNTYLRDNKRYDVIAFTATQIPDISGRKYPPELAGPLYPDGIPIFPEDEIESLIKQYEVEQVIMSYSDISHVQVMQKASQIIAIGADFRLMGTKHTCIKSNRPVIAVCAVRTGAGKSQVSRRLGRILRKHGKRVAVIRHPMPYGDLRKQIWQRFAELDDLDKHECTIEEREEYAPHIVAGNLVFAGVDYARILEEAEKEADIILWDGGNNDFPFYFPDLWITVADPHRLGHETSYYPGHTNLLAANIVIINKIDTAKSEDVETLTETVIKENPKAEIIKAESPVVVEDQSMIKGRRVLIVEDGPTVTHGDMEYGAGMVAAKKNQVAEIVNPRPFAVRSIKDTFNKYPHLSQVLPAMGYGRKQIKDLEETINMVDADVVIIGTPIDLRRLIRINKPATRVTYSLDDRSAQSLTNILRKKDFI